jgi:hypothetical protein
LGGAGRVGWARRCVSVGRSGRPTHRAVGCTPSSSFMSLSSARPVCSVAASSLAARSSERPCASISVLCVTYCGAVGVKTAGMCW